MTTSADNFGPKGFDSYPMALGDMLRGERATLDKTLLDVQNDLKIGFKYLAAIEDGDITVFETRGFIAGYVRSYARYLNLDGEVAFRQFCVETGFDGGRAEVTNRETPSLRIKESKIIAGVAANDAKRTSRMGAMTFGPQPWYESVSFSGLGSLAVLLLLVAGLGYGGWAVLQEVQRVQFAPVNETPGVTADITVLSDGALTAEKSPVVTGQGGTSPALSMDQLYRPQELEVPTIIARDGPISTINPQTQGALAPLPSPTQASIRPSDAPVAVALVYDPTAIDVVATSEAWVRVYLKDRSVLFEKVLQAGERYRLPADVVGPMLKAGNSGAVYVMIGNKTFGPVGSKAGVARNVSLSQGDVEANLAPVTGLFSEPLAPPLNHTSSDQVANAILNAVTQGAN